MDGTLANSEKYYVYVSQQCFRQRGVELSTKEISDNIVGATMAATYEYVAKVLNVDIETGKKIYDDYFLENPLNYQDYLYPSSLKLIKLLKQKNYLLALCTMNTKENVINFLKCGFEGLFDYVVYYEDGIKEKPYPDIYLKALEHFKINGQEAIVVEDSVAGVLAGKNAGAYVIGNKEAGLDIDLSRADRIIKNLDELVEDYE